MCSHVEKIQEAAVTGSHVKAVKSFQSGMRENENISHLCSGE